MSTFSSDRIPALPWARCWLLVALLVVPTIGSWELFLRAHGFRATADSTSTWILARSRLAPDSTVFIGTSRALADLEPLAWQEAYGGPRPITLAIPGGSLVPILDDLAAQSWFSGLVIAGVMPIHTFDTSGDADRLVEEPLDSYREASQSPSRFIEALLNVEVSVRLAFRHPRLSLQTVIGTLLLGHYPQPLVVARRIDGFTPHDYDRLNAPWTPEAGYLKEKYDWVGGLRRPARGDELAAILARLKVSIQRIQQRGGEVVLVLLPACGGYREAERRLTPREDYWERAVRELPAIAIDSYAHESLTGFPCYDGSHLHMRDAAVYSRNLAAAVKDDLARSERAKLDLTSTSRRRDTSEVTSR